MRSRDRQDFFGEREMTARGLKLRDLVDYFFRRASLRPLALNQRDQP
jgi:hypothetical protein